MIFVVLKTTLRVALCHSTNSLVTAMYNFHETSITRLPRFLMHIIARMMIPIITMIKMMPKMEPAMIAATGEVSLASKLLLACTYHKHARKNCLNIPFRLLSTSTSLLVTVTSSSQFSVIKNVGNTHIHSSLTVYVNNYILIVTLITDSYLVQTVTYLPFEKLYSVGFQDQYSDKL